MSYSIDFHLEPYFKIKTIIEYSKKDIKSCITHGKIDTNYCSKCGEEAKTTKEVVEYYYDIYELLGEDYFWVYHLDGYTYFFSNISNNGFKEPDENRMINVSIPEIKEHIKLFKKIHLTNIEKIEKFINKKIVIEYGYFKHVW